MVQSDMINFGIKIFDIFVIYTAGLFKAAAPLSPRLCNKYRLDATTRDCW